MKPDRFSSASTRAATALLACLLLAASLPAVGAPFTVRLGRATFTLESASTRRAKALAQQVEEVQQRFGANRRALRAVQGPGGTPAYPRQEVTGLIARTGKDLDQAIEQIGESELDALRAWSAEEIRRIQREAEAVPGQTAAWSPGDSTPRAVARVASLGASSLPQEETIAAKTSDRLLDQVGEVVSRIFLLADRDDLEVELWVGSTPAPKVIFSFWSQGKIRGAAAEPNIVQTNGKRSHVVRGLYSYKAAWAKGAVTELVAYPNPAGAPIASERLDLVNGSSFFCCRFGEQYCHHVASEKECRP